MSTLLFVQQTFSTLMTHEDPEAKMAHCDFLIWSFMHYYRMTVHHNGYTCILTCMLGAFYVGTFSTLMTLKDTQANRGQCDFSSYMEVPPLGTMGKNWSLSRLVQWEDEEGEKEEEGRGLWTVP